VIEPKPLAQAFDEFRRGKQRIYFGTNSQIEKTMKMPIKVVYFKTKGSKPPSVVARAKLLEVTRDMPPAVDRLNGSEKEAWNFYYGFLELVKLLEPIPLPTLRYYEGGKPVRNDQLGTCIVEEASYDVS
jgi:hypothetical protein